MKILVIQQKMIGDVLTTSILFEALRKKFPGAQLHYLLEDHTLAVVENNPNIDQIVIFDRRQHNSLLKLAGRIRKEKYKIVIDVYAKLGSALITGFSRAEKRISYQKWYTSPAYTRTFHRKNKPETPAGLAIENRMLLLKEISEDFPKELRPKIFLREQEKKASLEVLKNAGIAVKKHIIMVSALGSSPDKTYPSQYMAQVLDLIVARKDAQLLFNYIPKQREQALEIYRHCAPETRDRIFFDVFAKDLREFLAITYHCDALIGNEGGAINMAKALEIPTFAIFSPQISKQAWSSHESNFHRAVHLKDFHPSLFKKTRKSKRHELYYRFTPDLFFKDINLFLEEI